MITPAHPSPVGLCPLCRGELRSNGSFVECESGDYRTAEEQYRERWGKFDRDRAGIGLWTPEGNELAQALLKDLQGMNILRQETR